jgi:hypothetical protein
MPGRMNEQGKSMIYILTRCTRIAIAACHYKRAGKRQPFSHFIIIVVADTDGHVQH